MDIMKLRTHIHRNNLQHLLLTAMLMLCVQLPIAASPYKDFYHTYTNSAIVLTMLVDSKGTAWVGTTNGLMRYEDLKRPDDMRMAMPEELRVPINLIQGIKDGRLLVETRATKKLIFDPITYNVEEINQEWLDARGIANDGPWTIKIASRPEADALIESKGILYSVDLTSDSKAKLIKELEQPAIALSTDQNYYHILTPRKIYTYSFDTKKISETANPEETFAPKAMKDNKGNIWFGDKNLYHYDIKTGIWRKLRDDLMVTEIEKAGSDIYVGTSKSGIIHYNEGGELQGELHHNPFDINTPLSDHCELIYVDNKDNLWVAYNKNDLSISSQSYQTTLPRHIQSLQRQFVKDDVISLLPINDAEMLAGTDGNGLHLVNPETGKEMHDKSIMLPQIGDASITALYKDSNNRLWIGIYRQGLICVENGKQHKYLPNSSPFSIVEDSDGNIYIGTSGNGLYRIDSRLDKEPYKIDLQGETWIQKLSVDKSGQIYITTVSKIFTLEPKKLHATQLLKDLPNVFSSFHITSYPDSRSLLWMIGDDNDNCLRILDTATDSVYSIPTLAGVRFKSVIEDDSKNMWLASDNNIYNIVPQYDPSTRSYSFRHYAYNLRGNEGNTHKFNLRSVAKLSDGRLVFGGMNGYQIVEPANYHKLSHILESRGSLTALKINNEYVLPNQIMNGKTVLTKELGHTNEITLNSDENYLKLMFSPNDYDFPLNTEYYYRLDSTKGEWYPISGNMIEFIDLNPGKYHLEISAMQPDGTMSDEVESIDIKILPPWYKSAWAYIAYVVILLIIIACVVFYYIDRQKQKMKVAQAEKEISRQHQLNEMKLRFFTNISHDFRTPLSLIITPLETYLGKHSDKETSQFLQPVHKNAVRLLNLVNQILDFRKLDVTGIPLHLSYGDIVSYLKEICTSFNLFSEDSGIKMSVTTELKSLNMYFDKDKVSKIMMNLLSNAFKYNEKDGTVNVALDVTDDNMLQIRVADTGKGIPDEDKKRIFERFYQASDRHHTSMGCGIGLHIVKEFVTLHEGKVEVADNTPCGTVFIVSLPIKKTIGKESESTESKTENESNLSLEIPASETNQTETRPTILLVEDNQDFIDFMERSLEDDYHIHKAYNGLEALEILSKENIDMIISVVMMDKMDGLELCKAVKSDIKTSHIPIILLTARSMAEDELKGLESGADSYVTKPFSMPILQQRIAKLIEDHRRSQDKFRRIPDISPSEITITSLDEQFLSDAVRIVEENMSNPDFSVEMLSSLLGMHRTHLYKKLSGITGKSPLEFIRIIRLKRAAQYLAGSKMYISEIAYKVGFNNPRLMSKYFKEEYNMTPREYVRSLGLDNNIEPDDNT